ncbi:tannase and feruloyl esterase [Curvularia clavata]|uniref:Carboxylic ester hydrolase n=1 Tax=Curvularia clavata TaxID=95742 RepID=A0A9Q8ZFL7_CURCL|nr:tannase and feruloyl esterase [Curvularia clavata]
MSNYSITPALACNASSIPLPVLFGAEIIHVSANLVQNFSRVVSDQLYYNHPSIAVRSVDYCNITVTYTHPGYNDKINVETWLPIKTWNGRLQAIGGGGWIAGRFPLSDIGMAGAVGEGYVATTSDAGLGGWTPDPWALLSSGNVNLHALQNFASVALNDQAILAKELIKAFYGRPAEYAYWSGCSQGGRQGFMLAQRYPDAYDGIAAAAPAFNWAQFLPATSWAQVMMAITGQYPQKCEIDTLTDAAVAECDPLDGVIDGLITEESKCVFDPFTRVGETVHCPSTNATVVISNAAATIANLTWTGPRKPNGNFLWHGVNHQARLTGADAPAGTTSDLGYASTTCTVDGTCTGVPTGLGDKWLSLFIKKDPDWSVTDIKSVEEYVRLFHAGVQQYESIVGTADPDLSDFRDAGGKILTYHGLADGLIPTKGTEHYYNQVNSTTSDINDFFRYFEVPGLAHCSGGNGGQPTSTFQALVDWVEQGIVPETLPIDFDDEEGVSNQRILCPYPKKALLKEQGLDVTKRESWAFWKVAKKSGTKVDSDLSSVRD